MKSFRFKHNECCSLSDLINYIIFDRVSIQAEVDKIFIVNIKTGTARLTGKKREMKTVMSESNVNLKMYGIMLKRVISFYKSLC